MTYLKQGDKIHTDDGKREFVIDSLIHTGSGQGDIYKIHSGRDVYALKLFHTGDTRKLDQEGLIIYSEGSVNNALRS